MPLTGFTVTLLLLSLGSGARDVYALTLLPALALLAAAGASLNALQIVPGGPAWFHPGRSGTLRLGPKQIVATFGELHPAFLKAMRVDGPVIAVEFALDALPQAKAKPTKTRPVLDKADQTPVRRDFAFVVAAAALGIEPDQVGVKATTNEGMGFIGRGEGIAAMAVAVPAQPPASRTVTV